MGGRHIEDRAFWAGGNGTTYPKNPAVKEFTSADGAGELDYYEDTTEAIKMSQDMGEKKVMGNKMKPGYRQ